jgi:hypothetical protein
MGAGQDRRMGGERDGGSGEGVREARTFAGEPVENRGPRLPIAVGAHAIGAQRVDRDQQDIRTRVVTVPIAGNVDVDAVAAQQKEGRDQERATESQKNSQPIPLVRGMEDSSALRSPKLRVVSHASRTAGNMAAPLGRDYSPLPDRFRR